MRRTMQQKPPKLKALLQDWRWIAGVCLLLAIPAYGFTTPTHYAVIVHIAATVIYIGLLLMFGQGFVIEGALFVLVLASLFAMCSRPLQRFIQRDKVGLHGMWSNPAPQRT